MGILVTRLCNWCASLRQPSRVQWTSGANQTAGISGVVQNNISRLREHGSGLLLGGSARARCAVTPCLGLLRTSSAHTSWRVAPGEQHIWRVLDSRRALLRAWCLIQGAPPSAHGARFTKRALFTA